MSASELEARQRSAEIMMGNLERMQENECRSTNALLAWVEAEWPRRPPPPDDGWGDTPDAWALGIVTGDRPHPGEWPPAPTQAQGVRAVFKGVLWERDPVDVPTGGQAFKVSIVGTALFEQRPSFRGQGLDQPSEIVLAGDCPGLLAAIEAIPRGHARCRMSTADDVLTSLDHAIMTGPPEEPEE